MSLIFHTADWHLGARLMEHSRHAEHAHFLAWLLEQIREKSPRLLIVAGDIFDSANPPQQALTQYYEFLSAVSQTTTEVLILGGNHDSAAILHAPRDLLRSLRIRVVGSALENSGDALLDLGDLVVCAIPFLREKDVRRATAGQTFEEVAGQIREGILRHYREIFERACALADGRPVVGTGHLTALGVTNSASERAIHIGNLGAVSLECFTDFAYVALGHIHRPQNVGGQEHIRYSGSPIALGFDEADSPKQILQITISRSEQIEISSIPIPLARRLLRVATETKALAESLEKIPHSTDELTPWIELTVTDGTAHPDLESQVHAAAKNRALSILKLIVPTSDLENDATQAPFHGRDLADLRPEEIFRERLRREGIDLESPEASELLGTFSELLSKMQETVSAK